MHGTDSTTHSALAMFEPIPISCFLGLGSRFHWGYPRIYLSRVVQFTCREIYTLKVSERTLTRTSGQMSPFKILKKVSLD